MVGPPFKPCPVSTASPVKTANGSSTLKFLCSYGGKIVPRHPDGKLRYVGGHPRVLAVHRSICFSDLLSKLGELCGDDRVNLRCQLPADDLDALVSVKSDEDLAYLIEEYDQASHSFPSLKIRAFLTPPRSANRKPLPPISVGGTSSSKSLSPLTSSPTSGTASRFSVLTPPSVTLQRCVNHLPMPPNSAEKWTHHCACRYRSQFFVGHHWQ